MLITGLSSPSISHRRYFLIKSLVIKKDSKGSDCWTCTELKALPKLVLKDLANVFSSCFNSAANPHQNLLSLNPCLGKPNGGVRTISKTPMLYRMMSRCVFDSVVDWEQKHKQHSFDTAARGSSALAAALFRNTLSEMAYFNGEESMLICNDFDYIVYESQFHLPEQIIST